MEPMRESEVRLRRMLGPRARRWALYEFFCSALDRPWLMRSELQEFLHHLGLPFTRLLRPEWALLRSALGQPRRLSLAFLRQVGLVDQNSVWWIILGRCCCIRDIPIRKQPASLWHVMCLMQAS